MKFGPVPLEDALGKVLGHNIAGPNGRRLIRKGTLLSQEHLAALRAIGRTFVYVAQPEPGDLDENDAARATAEAVRGSGLQASRPAQGRVNLRASVCGLFRLDTSRLAKINALESVTIATRAPDTVARPGQTVATIKIIPYAIEEAVMRQVEAVATGDPLMRIDELTQRDVSLIYTGSLSVREKLAREFLPLIERIEALGSRIAFTDYVSLEDEGAEAKLAGILAQRHADGMHLIIIAGETTIMDRHDVAPRAVERAGGTVERLGAPVDPGNLFMLAYLDDTPVFGAPGCSRSRKPNITDWALPRLLAGDRLTDADIVALGPGGLLGS